MSPDRQQLKIVISPLASWSLTAAIVAVASVSYVTNSYAEPIGLGTVLPASCAVGEAFLLASTPASANLYICLQANQWTAQDLGPTGALSYLAPPSGSASRALTLKLRDVVSVRDFGADSTGVISATAAFTAAVAAAGDNSTVLIPPGTYSLATKWIIRQHNLTIRGNGAVITCGISTDDCIFLGDTSSHNGYSSITISNVTLVPGARSTGAAIHTNAQSTTVEYLRFAGNSTNYFAYGIQVDQDEDFILRNSPINAKVLRCDSSFCGSLLYNAPGTLNAAVGYISDSVLDPECQGNSIDWDGGNDLHLSSVILQAYSQFGLRFEETAGGADGRVVLNKVHNERGACINPAGNIGGAGNIMVGGNLQSDLAQLGGTQPRFAVTNPGATQYNYYVQPQGPSTWGGPVPIGYVPNGPTIIDASNYVALAWPTVPLAKSYNIYRVPVATSGRIVPTTTGNWLVANVAQSGDGTQTFTDDVTLPTLVTPPTPYWSPSLPFWPGSVVLSASNSRNSYTTAQYFGPASFGVFVASSWYTPYRW